MFGYHAMEVLGMLPEILSFDAIEIARILGEVAVVRTPLAPVLEIIRRH